MGGPRLHRLFPWFDPESAAVSSTRRESRIPVLRGIYLTVALLPCLCTGGHHTAGAVPGANVSPAGLHRHNSAKALYPATPFRDFSMSHFSLLKCHKTFNQHNAA